MDHSELVRIAPVSEIEFKKPFYARAGSVDLVVVRHDKGFSVLYGRCHHRGALLADGHVSGADLICGLHGWDYRYETGVSAYNNTERLHKFREVVRGEELFIERAELEEFERQHPQPFDREQYLGTYADTHPEPTEPYTAYIQELARYGLGKSGKHGPSVSMGVERDLLPAWNDIQFLPAQLARRPLLDEQMVVTKTVIGPGAKRPLELEMPLFISDMSFGALSREAKIALARGAEMAGTGICSGEGGMLPEEQAANSRYFYELASARFGFSWEKVEKAQAFHFKGGQGAKTGTGGHLPGEKVSPEIAAVRGLQPGQTAISPAAFDTLRTPEDFRRFGDEVRERTDGIPVGFKLAASHIERDVQFALDAGADYLILDGRGGGTGSAPSVLRNNINVPTIPALARARKYLDRAGAEHVSLVITGGLRLAEDYAKAMMLGADAVAISNAALQAIGCLGMRACGSNNCPVGIATQKEHLRSRLIVGASARMLANYLTATNELMMVIARACGYGRLDEFNPADLTTAHYDMHRLTGIPYGGYYNESTIRNQYPES